MAHQWRERAACKGRDPSLWYPPELDDLDDETAHRRETPKLYKEGRKICWDKCQVRHECLEHALTEREDIGMWGGLTRPERNTILKERRVRSRGCTRA